MTMTMIAIAVGALEMIPKGLEKYWKNRKSAVESKLSRPEH